jgi:LysR family transcriptional regulator, transcriptional activator AphB
MHGTMSSTDVSYDDLATFVEVARHLSFVEASRRAKVPASTVSRSVARLETALGVRLFQRTSRKVVLTDEGRQLLLRGAPSLDELREALIGVADRRAELRGRIRVTAPAFTGATRVARSLAAFAHAHPGVTIELDASNTIRDLIEDGFDLAIRVGPLADSDLVARHLWDGHFGLFAERAFLVKALRGRKSASRELLERSPAVVTRLSTGWRFRDDEGAITEVSPRTKFAVNDPRAAVEVARRGLGFVLAPLDAVPPRDRQLAVVRCDLGEPVPAPIYAVYPSRRLLPVRVKRALDWLTADGTTAASSA